MGAKVGRGRGRSRPSAGALRRRTSPPPRRRLPRACSDRRAGSRPPSRRRLPAGWPRSSRTSSCCLRLRCRCPSPSAALRCPAQPRPPMPSPSQALGERWAREGKTRVARPDLKVSHWGGINGGRIRTRPADPTPAPRQAVNARESLELGNAFLGAPFLARQVSGRGAVERLHLTAAAPPATPHPPSLADRRTSSRPRASGSSRSPSERPSRRGRSGADSWTDGYTIPRMNREHE